MQRTVCSCCQSGISESLPDSNMLQAGAKTETRPALLTRMCRGWSLALNLLTKLRIFSKLPTSSSMNSTLLLPKEALMASVALQHAAAWGIAGHSGEQSALLCSLWCCTCLSFTTALHAHGLSMLRLLHNVHGTLLQSRFGIHCSSACMHACMHAAALAWHAGTFTCEQQLVTRQMSQ
jgi:hypothetical protein